MAKAFQELLKYIQRGPGWIPLAALCYLLYPMLLRINHTISGIDLAENKDLVITLMTLILYSFGDALDTFIFKSSVKVIFPTLKHYKEKATIKLFDKDNIYKNSENLRIDSLEYSGIYTVSKSLAKAVGYYYKSWIGFKNELAKFFRSLIIPTAVGGLIVMIYSSETIIGMLLVLESIIFCFEYVSLKGWHMEQLYKFSSEGIYKYIKKEEQKIKDGEALQRIKLQKMNDIYSTIDIGNDIRLFFWDRNNFASGRHAVIMNNKYNKEEIDKQSPAKSNY